MNKEEQKLLALPPCFFIIFFKNGSNRPIRLLNKNFNTEKKLLAFVLDPFFNKTFHLKTRVLQNIERCNAEPNIKNRTKL